MLNKKILIMIVISVINYRGREIGSIEYCSLSELNELFAEYITGKVYESSDCLKMSKKTLEEIKYIISRHSFLQRDFRALVF